MLGRRARGGRPTVNGAVSLRTYFFKELRGEDAAARGRAVDFCWTATSRVACVLVISSTKKGGRGEGVSLGEGGRNSSACFEVFREVDLSK